MRCCLLINRDRRSYWRDATAVQQPVHNIVRRGDVHAPNCCRTG